MLINSNNFNNKKVSFSSRIVRNKFTSIAGYAGKQALESTEQATKTLGQNYKRAIKFISKDNKNDIIEFNFQKSHIPTAIRYDITINNVVSAGGHILNDIKSIGTQCCNVIINFAKQRGMNI